MKVESLKTAKVFSGGGDVHYILPHFQREYAWEKPHWQTLLDDIRSIYDIYDYKNEPEHFMGALVVISDGNRSGTIPAFKLVDGQQRLTTISLAFCALGNLVEVPHPKIHQKIVKMLINEGEQGLVRYKLLPTDKHDDREAFVSIIDGRIYSTSTHTRSRIQEAYDYIYRQLAKWLRDGIDPERLFLVFSNCLQFVFIDLDKRERPFEIFESLNAKGKPLSQPDLVRNYIAMMLPDDRQNKVFSNWIEIENTLSEDRNVSRIGELTSFLRHYLAFRNGILPNKRHVYARFRDRMQRDIISSEAFDTEIESLNRFANYYDCFLRPEREPDISLRRRLERLSVIESVTAYPFLLALFEEYHSHRIQRHDLLEALELVENYLIRRFLANEPTNYTNKMFPALSREININDIGGSLKTALLGRNYPTDNQIQRTLPMYEIYDARKRDRLVFVLNNINEYLSQGSDGYTTLADVPTIEHIMPQKLTSAWKQELGPTWDETYRDYLDTIGNLTLVTQQMNSALSNDDWPTKHSRFTQHALRINHQYFVADERKWDRDAIQRRAQWLIQNILRVWPAFGTPPIVVSYKGRSPTRLVIIGDEYQEVNSWRDVALAAMEFAISMTDDFQHFANSLQSAYLSREEKPRSRELSNGWWLYVNLSSDSVMTLCSRIFEQIELSDEDWEVELIEA